MASKLDRLKNKGFKNTENPLESIVRGDQEPGGEYMELNIDDIEVNPDNDIYREADTEEEIVLLANDIKRSGLLHNLVVCPKTGTANRYVLLSGERRLRALQYLVEQERREQEEKNLPKVMSNWQKVQCKVLRNLSDTEKVVYLDSANLQVRGGFNNEKVFRKASQRFVENLQKEPFNLSEGEAKKQLKEISPMNAKTIDKALDIQKYLDEGLRELLDAGFLSRAECEYYLRLDETEQKKAADVFEKIKKMNPLLPERKKIKKSMTQALTELVTIADIEERDRAFAKAVQEAEEAVAAAKPAGGKITSTDKDHNFIAGKVPMTTKKLARIAKAKNMRQKIETYTPEDRAAMAAQLRELIEASQKLVDLIESV